MSRHAPVLWADQSSHTSTVGTGTLEETLSGLVMQAELLLISRNKTAIKW